MGGEYYYGESAWKHLKEVTDIDLQDILIKIAEENRSGGLK
ncbi:restriction endonuclease [Enterococcus faecalis]|nr:restriction endonuclease [Enterococcus faecalis]